MTDTRSIYRRIIRRETHSPRALLAMVLAVALIVVFAWVGSEIVLALLGHSALLVAPRDMITAAARLDSDQNAAVTASGAGIAVVGILLIIAGVTPGRRARHTIELDRSAVIVDNEVIASALARSAAYAGDVDATNSHATVSHRRAVVRVTPASGVPVNRTAVTEAVDDDLAAFGLQPAVRAAVTIDERGRVGV